MEPADSTLGPRHPVERRTFMAMIAGGFVGASLVAEAQPARKMWRIGVLDPGFGPAGRIFSALRARLIELGYVEGQNLALDVRFAEGDATRLPLLAADLVRLAPTIIVTVGSAATIATRRATATIPILMVRDGIVETLRRPGSNVTGSTEVSNAELIGKQFQLIKEIIPRATRMALVPVPAPLTRAAENWLRDTEAAARSTGFTTQVLVVHDSKHWDQVFAAAARQHADVVYFIEWGPYIASAKLIADQAIRSRMPTLFAAPVHAVAGGLLAYGTNVPELARRAGDWVDKILKGARPAELPIEQPTPFVLVINLKTARALGLTVPPSVLARADQVIE